MTEKHRARLECLALVKHSAEAADDHYKRGDYQMSIVHLRTVIRRAEAAIERISSDE